MSEKDMQLFTFEQTKVRVIFKDDTPWWVAADVCEVLGLSNPSVAVAALDDDERSKFNLGRQGETSIVSEAGLYSLILRSSKGLDIILHTPGGSTAATESIVNYLRSLFGNNIRAFIPQIAMSAGTMIALSCKEIVMGKQSNIGPIDPQFGGMSCAGVIEEFQSAIEGIKTEAASAPLWQVIVSKYHPTFLGDCQKAIDWSRKMVTEWLSTNMLSDHDSPEEDSKKIVDILGSHKETFTHEKHIHIDECKKLGIKVVPLESLDNRELGGCKALQDCVLTIHHTYMHTFSNSNAVKIVENHLGSAMIMNAPLKISSVPVQV